METQGRSSSGQDGELFEECLRRCNALERKLTEKVSLFQFVMFETKCAGKLK